MGLAAEGMVIMSLYVLGTSEMEFAVGGETSEQDGRVSCAEVAGRGGCRCRGRFFSWWSVWLLIVLARTVMALASTKTRVFQAGAQFWVRAANCSWGEVLPAA